MSFDNVWENKGLVVLVQSRQQWTVNKGYQFVYLLDGRLSDLVRVFPDALQEVSELRHGRVSDLRPQFGDVFRHDGAEPVLTGSGETRELQLLQRPQRRVVPNKHTHLLNMQSTDFLWT